MVDGVVKETRYRKNDDKTKRRSKYYSIDQYFAMTEKSLDHKYDVVDVGYNKNIGYPNYIRINTDTYIRDAGGTE